MARTDNPSLQRQAPHSWNISPTYDRGRLSLRVGLSFNDANIFAYNYQDGADGGKTGPNGDQTFIRTCRSTHKPASVSKRASLP